MKQITLAVLLLAFVMPLAHAKTDAVENPFDNTKSSPVKPETDTSESNDCGSKTVCGQMDSCAEARHYLNDCGLSRLDRDRDGIPCEKLCR